MGRYIHPCHLIDDDELLINPTARIPCSEEISHILERHKDILGALLVWKPKLKKNANKLPPNTPNQDRVEEIPASIRDLPVVGVVVDNYVGQTKSEAKRNGLVEFTGGLSITTQSQIYDWFEHHVPGAKGNSALWISKAPGAHAITVVIAEQHRTEFEADEEFPAEDAAAQDGFILERAWRHQMHVLAEPAGLDVDLECLKDLEDRMYEWSAAAGIAGCQQWGLDAGDHERQWGPYFGLSSILHHDDLEVDEEVHEVSVSTS